MGAAASSIWHISQLDLAIRMVLAVVLGGLIGIEREWSNHAAGFRTHILVCLGSATIMLLSIYGFSDYVNETNVRIDPARLAAQVISGIGFLGAGAILRNGNVIKGLTTAASVWVVAAVGLCVGAGFLTGAFLCTFLALVSLYALNKWEKHLLRHRRYQEIEIKIIDKPGMLGRIASLLGEQGIQIVNLKMIPEQGSTPEQADDPEPMMKLIFSLQVQKPDKLVEAFERIAALEAVVSMETANFNFHKSGDVNGVPKGSH